MTSTLDVIESTAPVTSNIAGVGGNFYHYATSKQLIGQIEVLSTLVKDLTVKNVAKLKELAVAHQASLTSWKSGWEWIINKFSALILQTSPADVGEMMDVIQPALVNNMNVPDNLGALVLEVGKANPDPNVVCKLLDAHVHTLQTKLAELGNLMVVLTVVTNGIQLGVAIFALKRTSAVCKANNADRAKLQTDLNKVHAVLVKHTTAALNLVRQPSLITQAKVTSLQLKLTKNVEVPLLTISRSLDRIRTGAESRWNVSLNGLINGVIGTAAMAFIPGGAIAMPLLLAGYGFGAGAAIVSGVGMSFSWADLHKTEAMEKDVLQTTQNLKTTMTTLNDMMPPTPAEDTESDSDD